MSCMGKAGKVAALATALAGSTLGVGASPASAASITAHLGLFEGGCEPGRVGLEISGLIDVAEPIRRIRLNVWGSDPTWDDHLYGPVISTHEPPLFSPATYKKNLCLLPSTLDEDIGEDDIYVKVTFDKPNGQGYGVSTNTIHHRF